MRCINCGFDNPAGRSICAKCGEPLGSGSSVSQAMAYSAMNNAMPRPTIVGTGAANVSQCPNCRYPILNKAYTACPKCNTPLTSNAPQQASQDNKGMVTCSQCNESVPRHYHFCPNCGSKIHKATEWNGIRGIVNEEPMKEFPFSLTVIPEAGEELSIKERDFTCIENQTVVLNRENTDSENRSITSNQQAEIGCEDGRWFIRNLSDNQSTFMVANRKMELQDGDIILLGYRYFKFNKK